MSFRFLTRLAAIGGVFALFLGAPALAIVPAASQGTQSGATACWGHGHTEFDRCFCDPGWTGPQCGSQEAPPNCGDHGRASNMHCACEAGWVGKSCEVACAHGKLAHGKCACAKGWTGGACDAAAP